MIQADIKSFLLGKNDIYEAIFLRDVLEHFTKEEVIEILLLVHASLRQGSKLILQVPNAESPFFGRVRYGDFTHEVAFTTRSLSQILRILGIEKVDFYSVRPLPGSIRMTVRSTLWRLVELIYRILLFVELGKGSRIVTQNIVAVAEKRN